MGSSNQRVERIHAESYPEPVIGGTHLKPGDLAGPGRRYGNLPGTVAAVVRAPHLEAVTDGESPLVVLTLPESTLVAVAKAVHLGAGVDGYRLFARTATGDREALRKLLLDPSVREALQLTLTAADAETFAREAENAAQQAEDAADDIVLARSEPNPDDARDLDHDAALADELFDMGTRS